MRINLNFRQHYKKLLALSGLIVGLVTSAVLVNHALAQSSQPTTEVGQHIMNIYDRNQERVVVTKSRTVRQALKAADIEVNEQQDVVEPALDTELIAEKYNINIYRAQPVTVVDGALRKKITTAQQTPELIAKAAKLELHKEDEVQLGKADNLSIDGANVVMKINRATPVALTLYGKKSEIRTRASTVGELLAEKNIKMGANDTLSIDKSAKIVAGMSVELWRNGKQTATVEEEINFTVEKIQDANRDPSYREVKTAGEKGTRNVTYEIEMKNGVEISRKEIASVTTREPKKQVEVVGAKFNYTGGPLNEAQITALGMCESGMTATRNSGNGFYGAFQFMPSTWRNVAPSPYNSVMPHEAPLEAQKQAVQNLLSRSSIFTQFPGCAKKMRANGII